MRIVREFIHKLNRILSLSPGLGRAFWLSWHAARVWILLWFFLLILQGLLPAALVYLTKVIVDRLTASANFWPPVFWFAFTLVLSELSKTAMAWVQTGQSEAIQEEINRLIHQKSVSVDMAFYDTPEYYDQLHRARAVAGENTLALLQNTGGVFQNAITFSAMLAMIFRFGWFFPAALFLSALPAFYLLLHHSRLERRWRLESTGKERQAGYYDWLLTMDKPAAELRLFGLGGFFSKSFALLWRELKGARIQLAGEKALSEGVSNLFGILVTGLGVVWLLRQAFRGGVSLGDVVLFYQAFSQGQAVARAFFESLAGVYVNSLFLRDFFEFLGLRCGLKEPARPVSFPSPLREGIHFREVSFRYPGSARDVLKGFDMFIPAGKITALVGENGSGKSTLVKLLCRFYDPEAGSVTIDGVDLREFSSNELRRHVACLFQDPMRYQMSAGTNIRLGDVGGADGDGRVEKASQGSGADSVIGDLPHGFETRLGNWFEGSSELSVGQWQRLALARAFYRQAPVLILDEPTSAMDPWAESQWLEQLRRQTQGKTVLLITHRWSTAKCADRVFVWKTGELAEEKCYTGPSLGVKI